MWRQEAMIGSWCTLLQPSWDSTTSIPWWTNLGNCQDIFIRNPKIDKRTFIESNSNLEAGPHLFVNLRIFFLQGTPSQASFWQKFFTNPRSCHFHRFLELRIFCYSEWNAILVKSPSPLLLQSCLLTRWRIDKGVFESSWSLWFWSSRILWAGRCCLSLRWRWTWGWWSGIWGRWCWTCSRWWRISSLNKKKGSIRSLLYNFIPLI